MAALLSASAYCHASGLRRMARVLALDYPRPDRMRLAVYPDGSPRSAWLVRDPVHTLTHPLHDTPYAGGLLTPSTLTLLHYGLASNLNHYTLAYV